MMTSSNVNIFRVTGDLCGEFTVHRWIPAQRSETRNFDVFLDLRLNKRLSKQSWGWWFETLWRPLWRQCNVTSVNKLWGNLHQSTTISRIMHLQVGIITTVGYTPFSKMVDNRQLLWYQLCRPWHYRSLSQQFSVYIIRFSMPGYCT